MVHERPHILSNFHQLRRHRVSFIYLFTLNFYIWCCGRFAHEANTGRPKVISWPCTTISIKGYFVCRRSHVRISQLICTYLRGLNLVQPSLSFFPLYTIPSPDGPRTSRLRVIGGVSGAHAERVVDCQVDCCIQAIGCRAASSLPPSCIMQEGCPHLMQGGAWWHFSCERYPA
jgi:hypothetical protein